MLLKLTPSETAIPFLSVRRYTYILSALLLIAATALFFTKGINRGIDFEGGILLEIGSQSSIDLAEVRSAVSGLGLGDVAVQAFGTDTEALIRVERQPGDGEAQKAASTRVKESLGAAIGEFSVRRDEFVGPQVSGELVAQGIEAVLLAVGAVLLYIWFRFEWQFGVGAVVALIHDVWLTIGFFSLTGLEFNLSIVAAILTIVGYSLNDTVVVYDRVRENMRRFRKLEMVDLLNQTLNQTLSRTLMTSVTTLLALIALFVFGGAVIRGFTAAMIWGVVIGTYSSIFIAAPILLRLKVSRDAFIPEDAKLPGEKPTP